ncbi:nitrogenase component 1 [Inediibacterium massiliense]|uniref:nitrogenase component 1 n=1 Tax=Inediibacterium massiliense TaxID=1658111 RepID=UPI0006B41C2B|nr:nitrogenase component 1 [Inediibacterium massiliense]
MSINNISNTNHGNDFLSKVFYKKSCMEIINLALSIPDIYVLAIGPESCLRVLYFRALRKKQNQRLYLQTMSQNDLASSQHLDVAEMALREIIDHNDRKVKAVIVYISCSDMLIGSDFDSILKSIQRSHSIPVKLFKRGPLSKRRITPKERLSLIFTEILDTYLDNNIDGKNIENPIINILGEEKLIEQCQLKTLLKNKGYFKIQEFIACNSFSDFKNLSKATFSIVTDKFGINLAKYLKERFKIPYASISIECSEQEFNNAIKNKEER